MAFLQTASPGFLLLFRYALLGSDWWCGHLKPRSTEEFAMETLEELRAKEAKAAEQEDRG